MMTPSPSRRSPAREYTRATIKRPHPTVPLPDHYSPYAYSQFPRQRLQCPQSSPHLPYNPISNDSYNGPPHGGDPPYYLYHPYARPLHKPGYRAPHPPLPHPPAPPAPPLPQRLRDAQPRLGRGSPRSSPAPTNYYRAQAEYSSHHVPPRSQPSWDRTRPSQSQEDNVSLSQSRSECERRSRSESTGSREGSEMPENTPSPVDPERIRQWEEQQFRGGSYHSSAGSGSYREDDGNENGPEYGVIDPALMETSRSRCSPSSHGCDVHESTMDDVSLDGNGIGDADFEPEDTGINILNSQKRPNTEYYPSPHHQAQFASLAKRRGVGQQLQIGLNSLVDGDPEERPAYPIPTIIKCAILGSPHRQLTLSELYTAMEERFSYYRTSDKKSWRNSVRHNLSLNNQFDKKPRPMTEPGKGHYWVVNTELPQGNKRERKRNKKLGKRALAALAAEEARQARERQAKLNADVDSNIDSNKNDANKDGANKNGANKDGAHKDGANKDGANKNGVNKNGGKTDRLPRVPPMYPSRGPTIVTLPANAGSYAAVTGAITMPAVNRQLFRPWQGDLSSSSIGNDSIQTASSVSASSGSASVVSASQQDEDSLQKTIPSNASEQPKRERPPSGESSPHPGTNALQKTTPSGRSGQPPDKERTSERPPRLDVDALEKTTPSVKSKQPTGEYPLSGETSPRLTVSRSPQRSRGASQGSGAGERASWGVQRSSKSRDSRLYNPIAVGASPSTPRRSAFETIAAQIEREGIGASGRGGPGSKSRRLPARGRRCAIDADDSDSDNFPSDDDQEYLPNRARGR